MDQFTSGKRTRIVKRPYSPEPEEAIPNSRKRAVKTVVVHSSLPPPPPPPFIPDVFQIPPIPPKPVPKKKKITEASQVQRFKRANLPKEVTGLMNEWFVKHIEDPYPTEEEKQVIIKQTNLTLTQVNNWFSNKRIRYKRKLLEGAQRVQKFSTTKRR